MQRTARIEGVPARGAFICRVFGVGHCSAAGPAHDAQLVLRHGPEVMVCQLRMTQRTREPSAAGVALVRNDVDKRVPVTAPTLRVDGAVNLCH